MLARLLQGLVFGLIALALGGAFWWWQEGRPVVAVAWLLFVLGLHAWVLALEFALLRRAHGDDPAPRASAGQLLRAWWHEALAAPVVFGWRQPFRSRAELDHVPPDALGRRCVLLVHGFVCNRGLWNPWMRRLRAQGTPFVAVNLEPVFGSIDASAPTLEAAVRQLEAATGLAPVAVGHSMGGLALRAWLASDGRRERLHHVITLGTPHHGTWLARFALTRNARQMQQLSRWLQALEAREPPGHGARFTCFYSHCDNIVFPPCTATLAGADNRHVPGHAHVHLASHEGWWQELQAWLSRR
jgi:triacylglycerol esterase/lipase EstA (alpha/beta hydrolase family)